jgi:hypothetical protein
MVNAMGNDEDPSDEGKYPNADINKIVEEEEDEDDKTNTMVDDKNNNSQPAITEDP